MKTSFTLSSLHHTRNPPHLLLLKKIEVWMEGDTTPNTIQINIHRYSLIVEQYTYYILIDLFGDYYHRNKNSHNNNNSLLPKITWIISSAA